MVKKTNEDAILIKKLIEKKMPAWQISKQYGIKKQKLATGNIMKLKPLLKEAPISYMINIHLVSLL